MKSQKKFKLYSLVVMLTLFFTLNGFSQNPTITKVFDLNQPGTLNASSSGGSVRVETHNQPNVEIQAFVRKNSRIISYSDKDLNEILEDFNLDFSKSGSVITAVVKRKTRLKFLNNVGISLTVLVPRDMSCNVSSSGGSVEIYGVKGKHNISSSGGSVLLENVTGTTKAKSSGGGVKAYKQNGDINLRSSGGSVTVEDAIGDITAHSSGGGVHLSKIRGAADVSSSGGGVRINGEASYVKATSSGGSVKVDISGLSKELYLKSSGGGVSANIHNGDKMGLDLDLSSGRVNVDLRNFSGSSEKNRVKGTMNNGGIPVYMRASGGNVDLSFD
ncbi:MAG: DUF4097 family beta strand repeat protein [Prolixibacteraceae bacterium]|nr:DUF4097 family beta strand repeat protein [Prolixibacteraceae bacterium]